MVEYISSRLCFKADLIEPLNDNDSFIVYTPNGTFKFTKADFYHVFQMLLGPRAIKRVDYIALNIHLNELCSF